MSADARHALAPVAFDVLAPKAVDSDGPVRQTEPLAIIPSRVDFRFYSRGSSVAARVASVSNSNSNAIGPDQWLLLEEPGKHASA